MSLYPSPFAFITPFISTGPNFYTTSFETSTDGWTLSPYGSGSTFVRSTLVSHTGSYSVVYHSTHPGLQVEGAISLTLDTRAGTVSFYFWADSYDYLGGLGVGIVTVNGIQVTVTGALSMDNASEWQLGTFPVPTGSNTTISIDISLGSDGFASTFALDDITIPIP